MIPMASSEIAWAAQMACLLEASAKKPGNVTPGQGFPDARFDDFIYSAIAIGPAFHKAAQASVGETILRAIQDTQQFVSTNTNLGIVLLLAPLAKAAAKGHPEGLRVAVSQVLRALTQEDARLAYQAIRLAGPAGLGQVEKHDVREREISLTLREAMEIAQQRDAVAREYLTDFKITFKIGMVTLQRLWEQGHRLSDAIIQTFLTILAQVPDTLIQRKNGLAAAENVMRMAREVLQAGGALSTLGKKEVSRLDLALRDEQHRLNPGTTADLMAAVLFVFLGEGHMLKRFADLMRRW